MKKTEKMYSRLMIILCILLGITCIIAMCIGRFSVDPLDAFKTISNRISGNVENESMDIVLFVIRIPRILAAVIIGAALSLAGAAYQSVFKNPLVSPDILGVSNGACVGAAVAILLGFSMIYQQILAFCVGIIAVMMAIALPKLLRRTSNLMMVLSGTIVSAFMCSILGVLKFVAEEDTELAEIIYWQMGSLANIKMNSILSISPIFFICGFIMVLLSWRLNIMSFGESEAKTLGVNLKLLRSIYIIGASMMTASAVCLSGTISWLGLIIPHLGRLVIGADNTKLLPICMLLGAEFLLIMDTLARVMTSLEIPISILTGMIGAPVYAWLLWKQRGRVF